jgi:hypothetical protein
MGITYKVKRIRRRLLGLFVYWLVGNPLTSSEFIMAEPHGCGIKETNITRNAVIDKAYHACGRGDKTAL